MWTPTGWYDGADPIAAAIDHAAGQHGYHATTVLYPHPSTWGGLLGVASLRIRGGTVEFDVHGFPSNFMFDGAQITQWRSGGTYEPLFNTALIRSNNDDDSDFALDPATSNGILVGTIGDGSRHDWR